MFRWLAAVSLLLLIIVFVAGVQGTQAQATYGRTNSPVLMVPTAPATVPPTMEQRIEICHKTGSTFREITINRSALRAHLAHGDIYPVPVGGCPRTVPSPVPTP